MILLETAGMEWYELEDILDDIEEQINAAKGYVDPVVLAGSVGLWNGSVEGSSRGQSEFSFNENFIGLDTDEIVLSVEDNGEVLFALHHHDASHYMNCYSVDMDLFEEVYGDDFPYYEEMIYATGLLHVEDFDVEDIGVFTKILKYNESEGFYFELLS